MSDSAPSGIGKYKNYIFIGGAIIAGYFLYEYYFKGGGSSDASSSAPSAQAVIPAPDLYGPLVFRNAPASSKSPVCATKPVPGLMYALVTYVDAQGYHFVPQHNGHFTRRFLCTGNQKWAEIRPT
jgi:hypothetical protein